jgi:hypothetical protein
VLLECNDREMTQTVALAGRRYLSVATLLNDGEPARKSFVKRLEGGFKLRTVLCDVPATPNSKLTKTIVETRSECDPFTSIPLHEIRQRGVGALPLQHGRHDAQCEDTVRDHAVLRQPILASAINGIIASSSDQLNGAVDDLRSSTTDVIPRSAEEDVCQDFVALGSHLWTQSSRNT